MQFFTNLLVAALSVSGAFAAAVPKGARAGDVIEDSYIVVLKDSVSEEAVSTHKAWAKEIHARSLGKRDGSVAGVEREYNFGSLKGYAGSFDKATIEEIATSSEVAYIEPDRVMTANALVSFFSASESLDISY